MAEQFVCSQCCTILNESERMPHISAQHLDYFPFGCTFCTKASLKFLTTTEADMNEHIAAYHNGNNTGIVLLKDQNKEVELNKMIEQCDRYFNHRVPSIDSKCKLRRAVSLLENDDTSIRTDNAARNGSGLMQMKTEIESDDSIIIIEDDSETAATSNNFSEVNIPEQTTQVEINEPNKQFVAHPITENTQNYEYTVCPHVVLPKTEPSVSILIAPEPHNFIESHVEMGFSSQSALNRKRRLPDSVCNDSVEGREQRRLVTNDKQLASGGHCSREVNHGSGNGSSQSVKPALINAIMSQRKDRVERPPAFAQIISSVPVDSLQKQIITKLFIVISHGIVCCETIDRHIHPYAPLRKYLSILAGSELCNNGCEVVIQFNAGDTAIPFKYRYYGQKYKEEFTSFGQLKSFAQELHSIAFLWADATVVAHIGPFKKKSNESPSQSDYCSELFRRERSILKCKKLDVTLVDNWTLSIVTNVVDRCEECELQLEESPGNNQLHEAFLKELYEREVTNKIAVTLCIPDVENANDFIEKLKARFRRAPRKCFKFELFTHSPEVDKLSLKIQDCILRSKTSKNYLESVIIEQRAIGS